MRFNKIKVSKDARYRFEYEVEKNDGEVDELTLSSKDRPRPEFLTALNKLKPFAIKICELPSSYESKIEVRGVSFSYGGASETMGATITSIMTLENSTAPLILNTPHKTETFYSEHGDARQLLPDGCAKALNDLCDEAELYIRGERAQGRLNGC
ncbi:MAG: hypothetical protein A4E60_00199 [Syntrophorhabdus sp. PtaB.Bin047]|jgi:hypothetical protein|nr:MAG: hypothetical protein A4E60_00199 [Syntrophorhabdus sp. PtaB.Bin047]